MEYRSETSMRIHKSVFSDADERLLEQSLRIRPPTLDELTEAIEKSWSRETSFNPKAWSKDKPAIGQCTVSALVVDTYRGGFLVRLDAILPDGEIVVHYRNELPDESTLDLTRRQFPAGTTFGVPLYRAREKPLSHPSVQYRFELLIRNVARELAYRPS